MTGRSRLVWAGLLAMAIIVAAVGSAVAQGPKARSTATSKGALSAAEIEGLTFTREEEKLARDVYQTLGAQWNMAVFDNIASAEQNHMDAVGQLLDRYGLADPAAGNGVGVFTDPGLQTLYDDLIAQGSQSLVDALKVGAMIEEMDIADLERLIADSTHADLDRVYENLLRGSRNHLRAFDRALQRQGAIYEPSYLSGAEYRAIADSATETGRSAGRGGRR